MSQSLARVVIHIVFSTKHRVPWLKDLRLRRELHSYMAKVLQSLDSPAIAIDGTEDHVHILCTLSRKVPVKRIVEEVKKQPSRWIKSKGPDYQSFYWQGGYGVFSVGESQVTAVRGYILNQKTHHREVSFKNEFRRTCSQCRVELDERYVWS